MASRFASLHAWALAVVLGGTALLIAPGRSAGGGPAPAVDRHGDPLPRGAVARIGTTRFRQWDSGYTVAFSPDGRYVALGCSAGTYPAQSLAVFEARTGKVVHRLPGHAHVVRAVAFSPDGNLLAAGGGDGKLAVWDVAKGRRLCEAGPDLASGIIVFLAGSRTLATDEAGKNIRLLDARTGKPGRLLTGHTDSIFSIAASPDGKRLVSCAMDGTVRLWDVVSGKEVQQLRVAEKYGLSVAFSPDGKRVACGTYMGDVYLWDLSTGKERWRFRKGTDAAASVAFSPDGSEVYTVRRELRALDAETGKERRRFKLPQETYRLALSPDGKVAALVSSGCEVRLFDPVRGGFVRGVEGHAHAVTSVAFSPDGRSLATASHEPQFRVWEAATGRLRQTFAGAASSVAFAPDGRTLMAGRPWHSPSLWDAGTGKLLRKLSPKERGAGGGRVAFVPGQPTLAASDEGGRLTFWDPATGKLHPHVYVTQPNLVRSTIDYTMAYALSPDGKTAAVLPDLSELEPILLWDLRTGKDVLRTRVHGAPCAFSPDGGLLAALPGRRGTPAAGGVVLADTRTGREVRRLKVPAGSVSEVVFSPDGHMVATAGQDGTVRLWETASGQERHVFRGHEQRVLCLAFSPDGSRLASGSGDLTALVWDVYGTAAKGPHPARTADALWAELSDPKADRAFEALRHLLRNPEQAVALGRARLKPTAAADPGRVRALVAQLDSGRFALRDKARAELVKMGHGAIALLEKAAADKAASLESRRRLGQILDQLRALPQSPEGLRAGRLIEALERVGSAGARQVLGELAAGAGGAPQTEAARAALRRLRLPPRSPSP
jgi:WD40 repeat protein